MNVTKPLRTRRIHSEEFKQSLIEASGEPGASVAGVVLSNGINANQLRRWMRKRGIEPLELSCLPLPALPIDSTNDTLGTWQSEHWPTPFKSKWKRRTTALTCLSSGEE